MPYRLDPDRQRVVVGAIMGLVFALALLMPTAYFTIDEVHYHLMADRLVDAFRFDIPNRLGADAPAEMIPYLAVEANGRVVPQYPHLYAFLAAPFQLAFGMRGLVLLNAVAYAGLLAASYAIAMRLYRDKTVAMVACCILAFATYSLEYAAAIWPHALATSLVAFAVLSALLSNERNGERGGILWAVASGACLGLGIGVRLDVVFGALAVAGCLMTAPRWFSRGVACALATAPALLALAAVNAVKFGTFIPFSYGVGRSGLAADVARYVPILAAFAAAIGLALVGPAFRRSAQLLPRIRTAVKVAGLGALLGGLALAASMTTMGARLLNGLAQIVMDLRLRPTDPSDLGMVRTPDGAAFYYDSAKKSLLQSCPFLALALLDALWRSRHPDERRATVVLLLPVAAYVSVYSYFAWHGGLAYNMRYLTPALPFLAILTARPFVGLLRALDGRARMVAAWLWPLSALILISVGAPYVLGIPKGGVLEDTEWTRGHVAWMLELPLWLAVGSAACWLLNLIAGPAWRGPAAVVTAGAFAVTLGWGSVAGLVHDLVHDLGKRSFHAMEADWAEAHLPPESLLLVDTSDHLYALLADRDVHIGALRGGDASRPLNEFAEPYARDGREAYLFGSHAVIARLDRQGALERIRLVPVDSYNARTLYRIHLSAPELSVADPSGAVTFSGR